MDFLSGEKGLPLMPPGLGSDLCRLWLPARVGFHLERHIWKNSLDEYLGFILTMPRRAEGRERGSMLALCGALTDGRTDGETEAVRGGGLRGVAVFVSDLGRVERINGVIISP